MAKVDVREYPRIVPLDRGDKSQGTKRDPRGRHWAMQLLRGGFAAGRKLFAQAVSCVSYPEAIGLLAVGLLAARARLFGEACPFGAAFFILIVLTNSRLALPVFLGVLLGTSSLGRSQAALWLIAGGLSWYLLNRKPRALRKMSPALITSLSFAIVLSITGLANGDLPWRWAIVYVILLHLTINLLRPIIHVRSLHPGDVLASDQVVGIAMICVAVLLGLSGLTLSSVNFQMAASMTLLLFIASQWGMGHGAVSSLCIGALAAPAVMVSFPTAIGMFGLVGVGTALGAKHGKAGAIVGFIGANFLVSMDIVELSSLQSWWLHSAIALVLFVVVPYRRMVAWTTYFPGTRASMHKAVATETRLKREINARFKDLSKVFSDLSGTFRGLPGSAKKQALDYSNFLDKLSEKACSDCPRYGECWKDSFYVTYWTFMELLAKAEKQGRVTFADLGSDVKDRCLRPAQLTMGVNYLLELLRIDSSWQRKVAESQEIVSTQLQGVAQIFESLSSEAHFTANFAEEYEEKLQTNLRRAGFPMEVNVSKGSGGRFSVTLTGELAEDLNAVNKSLRGLVSSAMGEKYTLWQERRDEGERAVTSLLYLPEPNFQLEVHSDSAAKDDGRISGDSFSQVRLNNGKEAFIISDGMGHGSRAALESSTTVKLLRQLIDCGFEKELAVRTVNSILLLRSQDETFATVDLALVDLYSGVTEFIKIGAAPSYIVRKNEKVERVQANTLPIGILSSVDYHAETKSMGSGDTILMVTDGIVDACKGPVPGDEWLLHYLSAPMRSSIDNLSETLLQKARSSESGAKDDLTAVTITLRQAGTAPEVTDGSDLPAIVRTTA